MTNKTWLAALFATVVVLSVLVPVTAGSTSLTMDATTETTPKFHKPRGDYSAVPYNDSEMAPNTKTHNESAAKDPFASHGPGDTAASYKQLSSAEGVEVDYKGFEVLHYIILYDVSGDFDYSHCITPDTAQFGIDRNNDEPGLTTDVGLITKFEGSTFLPHRIIVNFPDEGDPFESSRTVFLNNDDQVVAAQEDCYYNPEEPGWYQFRGFANGTTYDGNEAKINLYSYYFYICECNSTQEAEDKLGPAPFTESSTTPTETPTPTPTPEGTPTPTPEGTPIPTAENTPTPTPAAEDTPTPTAENTPTPTAENNPTPTQDGTPTPTAKGTPTQTSNQPTDQQTEPPATNQQQNNGAGGPTTPMGGPGFGIIVAVLGLLAAVLLAMRRD